VLVPEDRDLAVEAVDRAPHVRLVQQHAGVVDQVARGEVVGAVDDQVVLAEDLQHVVAVQPRLVQADVDQRVDLADGVARALGLGPADVGDAVDDLALQVRLVDDVELDDAERADTGGGQVHEHRRAEAARTDGEHLGVLQSLLPVHPDVRDDQVAAVPADLVDREIGSGLHQGWQGHGGSSCGSPQRPGAARSSAQQPDTRRSSRRPGTGPSVRPWAAPSASVHRTTSGSP
jgi:hypothetical protein